MREGNGLQRFRADLLALAVLLLLVLGLVMLASTSVFGVHARSEDPYFDVKRQLVWVLTGVCLALWLAVSDYRRLRPLGWWMYGIALALLLACFIPGLGVEINGERRWVHLVGKSLQPSELGKVVLMIVLAGWYARPDCLIEDWKKGFLWPGLVAAVVVALIALEVDIGTTVVLGVAAGGVMYAAGVPRKFLGGGLLAGIAAVAALALLMPEKTGRLTTFVKGIRVGEVTDYQQKMAELALGSGGIEGVGLGAGRMKMKYLPFAHTDFIFPMIGEELGIAATTGVVLCFLTFAIMGISIAAAAPDPFGRLLGTGMVLCVAVQAAVNIAVTTGVFPNTGLPLPFVSYGGSNLVCSLFCSGVLLSIHRETGRARLREDLPAKEEPMIPRI
jgi:cell division protein FtsW